MFEPLYIEPQPGDKLYTGIFSWDGEFEEIDVYAPNTDLAKARLFEKAHKEYNPGWIFHSMQENISCVISVMR